MERISIDPADINISLVKKTADLIRQGGIVALPTETVYGLAVRADKKDVVDKLYQVKQRPREKPFPYVVDNSYKAINDYFSLLSPFGYRLMERFWPGPLTIVSHTPQDRKIGVRIPSHIITLEILKHLNISVYLPSANISGKAPAISAQDVEAIFDGKIDLIVDSGKSLHSKSSTVIDLTYRPFKILRKGIISESEIAETFTKKRILFVCTGNTCRSPMAEFLLKKYLEETKPYLKDRYEIISRGTSFMQGNRPAPNVLSILKEKENLEPKDFSSRRLDRKIILSSDYIFTMEDAQCDYILRLEPTAKGKVFALRKFLPAKLEKDIPDPIGKSPDVYEDVYHLIRKAILELREWL